MSENPTAEISGVVPAAAPITPKPAPAVAPGYLPESKPAPIATPTVTLRALIAAANEVLDKTDQPFTQRLASDRSLRHDVSQHLGAVRGYRDDLLNLGVAPWIVWSDLREMEAYTPKQQATLTTDAAEDEDVIEEVVENLDFSDFEKRFEDELADYAKDAVAEMDTYDLVKAHGASELAENEDVQREVLQNAKAEDILDIVDASDFADNDDVREAVLEELMPGEIRQMAGTAEVKELLFDTLEADDYEKLATKQSVRDAVCTTFSAKDAARVVEDGNATAMASNSDVRSRVLSALFDEERDMLAVKQSVRERVMETLDKADIEYAVAKNPALIAWITSTRVNELAIAASAALTAARLSLEDAQRELAGLKS